MKKRAVNEKRTTGNRKPRAGGLWVLNLVLLVGLGLVTLEPIAWAQSGSEAGRPRGEYSVVAGETVGGVASVIYVLDTVNREMVALRWNDSVKALEGIGYRDLSKDAMGDPDR